MKVLHWISKENCTEIPVTLYNRLLDQNDKLREDSKIVYSALVPSEILKSK